MRRFNYERLRKIIKRDKNKTIVGTLKALIERKNSVLRAALIELAAKGKTNKEIAMIIGVGYATFSYYIGKDTASSEALKRDLSLAREYRNIIKHEKIVRKTMKSLKQ